MTNNCNVISDYPLIRVFSEILSKDECAELIDHTKDKLKAGSVVSNAGKAEPVVDREYRDASTYAIRDPAEFSNTSKIYDKISELTGFDKSQFEPLTVIKYEKNQFFKVHQDYFITMDKEEHREATKKRCSNGGNRISTVIIYLNDVELGGETQFPWIKDGVVLPSAGSMLQFNYNYDDWQANIRTQHAGLPVIREEKWIAVVWIREQSRSSHVENYKLFAQENKIYSSLTDVHFSIECGPEWDKRTLELKLPANDNPMNAIVLGYTGSMESTLLLYLLGILNNNLLISYMIQPVTVTSELCKDPNKITENWESLKDIHKDICDDIDGNIRKICFTSAPENCPRKYQSIEGLHQYMRAESWVHGGKNLKYVELKMGKKMLLHLRRANRKFVYLGDNEHPNDDDPRWSNIGHTRVKNTNENWLQPFFNLQKYHILDLYLKLNLEHLLKKIGVQCGVKHHDIDEECMSFACNERRWAFKKINNLEFAEKYFLTKKE